MLALAGEGSVGRQEDGHVVVVRVMIGIGCQESGESCLNPAQVETMPSGPASTVPPSGWWNTKPGATTSRTASQSSSLKPWIYGCGHSVGLLQIRGSVWALGHDGRSLWLFGESSRSQSR